MAKKTHSYRELKRRDFNYFVLLAIREPETLKECIELLKDSPAPYTQRRVKSMITAMQVGNTLIMMKDTIKNLSAYTPYVKEIRQLLTTHYQPTLF